MTDLPDNLRMKDALKMFYNEHGLPPDGGTTSRLFKVQIGFIKFHLPNPKMRQQVVLFHDMNHILTNYKADFFTGEIQIAGYEISSGCGKYLFAWWINLCFYALGLIINPKLLFIGFMRGRNCKGIYYYAKELNNPLEMRIGAIKEKLGFNKPINKTNWKDILLFAFWGIIAILNLMVFITPFFLIVLYVLYHFWF